MGEPRLGKLGELPPLKSTDLAGLDDRPGEGALASRMPPRIVRLR
jgi:hypothetical protein